MINKDKSVYEKERDNLVQVGALMDGYKQAAEATFLYVRKLRALGFDQPWIHVEYFGNESDPGFEWSQASHHGPDGHKFKSRIRLEVR